MNGKVLRVKENNLTFGTTTRIVNIFGCFKYKPNGNIYIIYADTDTKYNIIYYGSGHIKDITVLCMQCRTKEEEEIIKEYLFKVVNNESLDNFELISLENTENIEIIASSKLEIKPEILNILIDKLIPKKEEIKVESNNVSKKKKKPNILLMLLVLIIVGIGLYYYLFGNTPKDTTEKIITCTKNYQHDTLKASVEETNKYNFNIQDELERIDTTMVYQFNEEDYLEFIMKGIHYKYMPSSDIDGGWDKDDESYTFKVITKENIDTSYNEPTNYEEVLTFYKSKGYRCTEKIENE